MDEDIGRMIERLRRMEEAIEKKIEQRRKEFAYRIENRKIIFTTEMLAQQRRFKVGLIAYLLSSSLTQLICMPVIYGLIVPLALLDGSLFVYQRICFLLWGLPRLDRRDYVALDRYHLVYLNGIQKLNCLYCGYANGVIAMAREIASQTEQYWCPIKHAARLRGAHARYRDFLEYGDAEGFLHKSAAYRQQLQHPTPPPTR